MAATNWTIITRRKDNGKVVTFPLLSKWTYLIWKQNGRTKQR